MKNPSEFIIMAISYLGTLLAGVLLTGLFYENSVVDGLKVRMKYLESLNSDKRAAQLEAMKDSVEKARKWCLENKQEGKGASYLVFNVANEDGSFDSYPIRNLSVERGHFSVNVDERFVSPEIGSRKFKLEEYGWE